MLLQNPQKTDRLHPVSLAMANDTDQPWFKGNYALSPEWYKIIKNKSGKTDVTGAMIFMQLIQNPPMYKSYYANLYGWSEKTIDTAFKNLHRLKLIDKIPFPTREEAKERLCQKRVSGGEGHLVCEWCGIKTFVIHKHHYPIPRRNNGVDTVNICAICHDEYHYIRKVNLYVVKPEIQKKFTADLERIKKDEPILIHELKPM